MWLWKKKRSIKQNLNERKMANLGDLKLKQLRELFPEIKARAKEEFLRELAEAQEVDYEEIIEEPVIITESEEELDIVDYVLQNAKSNKKILIRAESSMEADNIFAVLQFEAFPKLEEAGILLVASTPRRDMSLNGTCYIRITCKNNYELVKGLYKFTDFKEA